MSLRAEDLDHAAELIEQADGLIVVAGAGMGVDSGLPDFRGQEGFWRAYPALGRERIDFTQVANPAAFRQWPERAWGFYGHRLARYRATQPHTGFALLRQWGMHRPHGHAVFTSNVDGQFQRAGFHAGPVHECHGSIHFLQCMRPCSDAIWPADDWTPDIDEGACLLRGPLPKCIRCGGLARPNILMFGDDGWIADREVAQARAFGHWLREVRRPVVIEVGAGTAVPSVRAFAHQMLIHHGARLIRINPREPTVPSKRDVGLATSALDALAQIDQRLSR